MTTRVVIAGVAEAEVNWKTDLAAVDIMALAVHRALADAGVRLGDVDGVFAVSPYYWMPALTLAEYLGIEPRVSDSTNMGGASVVAHIGHALSAIQAGACEVAVIAYASTQRSDTGRLVTGSDVLPYERPYGPLFPISSYALVAQRHMYEYGTTRGQLAQVAVTARQWAALNPGALKRDPITVADVIGSPLVSDPLRRLDCCLVTNGGGAVVVTTADRARRLPSKPVHVLGVADRHSHRHITAMPDFTTTAAVASGTAAWEMAGLGPRDMDVVEIYDAFTINTIIGLEDLGFCAKGDGGRLIESGTGPGSKLPVNTSGGGLAYCHPGMFGIFLLVEAVRQLRGQCGARQVPAARHAVAHAFGGVFSGNATVVLGGDS